MLLVKRAMIKRSRDPARVERVRTTPCKNLERIELSSESLMHHEPGNSAKKVLAVTSGLNDCIGSMTAMMSAAAPPGAAQQYRESFTNELTWTSYRLWPSACCKPLGEPNECRIMGELLGHELLWRVATQAAAPPHELYHIDREACGSLRLP